MTETRIGDWFMSLKGAKRWPLDPRVEDVDIEEIAHALSNICRYGGHVPGYQIYSVAQHSVHVLECVTAMGFKAYDKLEPAMRLVALLHDGPEAYLGDVIRPLKRGGAVTRAWLDADDAWMRCIGASVGLPASTVDPLPAIVKIADDRVLLAERRDLLAQSEHQWRESEQRWMKEGRTPWEGKIAIWSPLYARTRFLDAYKSLVAEMGK